MTVNCVRGLHPFQPPPTEGIPLNSTTCLTPCATFMFDADHGRLPPTSFAGKMSVTPTANGQWTLSSLGTPERPPIPKTTTLCAQHGPVSHGDSRYPSHKSRSMDFVDKMKAIRRSDWQGALCALAEAERLEARIAKDPEAGMESGVTLFMYSSLLRILASNRRWQEALGVLERMLAGGMIPDQYCLAAALEACSKAGQLDRALELLQKAKRSKWVLDCFCYAIVITACSRNGNLDQAVNVLREMRSVGVTPSAVSYRDLIAACGNSGKWEQALVLLGEMPAAGIAPDVSHYSSAITACGKSGEFEEAVTILEEMSTDNVAPDDRCFGAVLLACIRGGGWEQASAVFRDMQAAGIPPGVVVFNAAKAASKTTDHRDQALMLLKEMQTADGSPVASSGSCGE